MIQTCMPDQHGCFFELFLIIFRLSRNINHFYVVSFFLGEPDLFICNKFQDIFDTSVMYQKDLQKS